MAKKSDIKAPTSSMRRGSAGKVFVWIILVLLILGLAGFGANSVGGSISSIGSVGDTEIDVGEFQRALQQEVANETRARGEPVSIQRARAEGLDQRVLQRLAGNAALVEEARVSGLSVGDDEVARQLQAVPAFQGANGFNRETYEFALRQNGMRASEFEAQLRETTAVQLLQQSVTGGLTVPQTYADSLYGFLSERRSLRWALVDASRLEGDPAEPSEAALAAFHEDNAELFRTPEIRRVSYAWLTPDMLLDTIEVDDTELRGLYDARADQYIRPARRLVERLGFSDMEAALAAKAQLDAGEVTFDALVTERGLTLEDVDQGEVARADLDGAIADAVFALEEPGISEPVTTSLGPALFRINAILEASETSFEEARDDLLAEFTADRARRIIEEEIVTIDDLLVGGATMDDLANETPMQKGTLDFTGEASDGISQYDEFRAEVAALSVNDFAEVRELSDGGIFAVQLDEIVPPQLPPLAEIQEVVSNRWAEAQEAEALRALADDFAEQIREGTRMATLDLAAKAERDIRRSEFIQGAPIGMVTVSYGLDTGEIAVVQDDQGVTAIIELLDIADADMTTPQAQALTGQFNAAASQGIAADVYQLFGQAVQQRHGLSIDQTAINAVLTQLGGGAHGGL